MAFSFADLRAGKTSYADVIKDIRPEDLRSQTEQLFEDALAIIAGLRDEAVTLVPRDPAATSGDEQGWTLGHVVAHFTATLEETAASAAMLARGVQIEERLRYEVPWESITTLAQVEARLHESRRISLAFLNAWPDQPHLDLTVARIPALGPLNAIGISMLGVFHGQDHLGQMREIIRQAKEALATQ